MCYHGVSFRILFGTSALLYVCATINVAASLRQELEAFILVPPDAPPYYASLYYSSPSHRMALLKYSTYAIAVCSYYPNINLRTIDSFDRCSSKTSCWSVISSMFYVTDYKLVRRLGVCTLSGHITGRLSCYQ